MRATAQILMIVTLVGILSTAGLGLQVPAGSSGTYTITNLGTLGSPGNSEAYAISDNGLIGGTSTIDGSPLGSTPFLYVNGVMSQLAPTGGNTWDVNSAGMAAGNLRFNMPCCVGRAFLFDGNQILVLGTLGGADSAGYGMNRFGDVTGDSLAPQPDGSVQTHAFLYRNGVMTDLGTLGGAYSTAYGVNDAGVVVGESSSSDDFRGVPFVYQAGIMSPLVPPGSGTASGYAFRVNNNGQIIGGRGGGLGFLYDNGTFIDIPSVGGTTSDPLGMNDEGDVVGLSRIAGDAEQHAFLFRTGVTVDLNDYLPSGSGWVLREAYDINNAGVIVGAGLLNGDLRAFRLTPTGATQTGSDVTVNQSVDLPGGGTSPLSLTFGTVSTAGQTTISTSETGPAVPAGFRLSDPPLYIDVQTTAGFTGNVTLCFSWTEGALQNEANARLLHYEDNAWADVTTSVNTQSNVVCGVTTSLSPFVIAEFGYEFLGFQLPLLPDGSASIQQTKAGRTIPVKFQLKFRGQLTGTATARIAVYRVLDVHTGTVDTTDRTEDAGAANENGDNFRYDAASGQYIFNLSTKGWLAPATYKVILTLSDGGIHWTHFSLR